MLNLSYGFASAMSTVPRRLQQHLDTANAQPFSLALLVLALEQQLAWCDLVSAMISGLDYAATPAYEFDFRWCSQLLAGIDYVND